MKSIVQSELHDAKLKLVQAINNQDKEMIKAYERVIKELEQALKSLEKQWLLLCGGWFTLQSDVET